MPAYEAGGPGSSPGGGTEARLVQRQSSCPTNRESGFESSAGYGGCGVVAASEAVNFRGRDRNPAITPGSVAQRRPHSAVNRASHAQVRVLPGPPWIYLLPVRELPLPLRRAAAWFES